jgi:orotate phosphoribosyltransferase
MDELSLLIRAHVRRGEFTLSSGRHSDFYIDGKAVALDPRGSLLIAERLCGWIERDQPDALGGPELGACPLVSATGVIAAQRALSLKLFYVRKQPKTYGTTDQLVGWTPSAGECAILVEDVVTSGGSLLRAVEVVRALGARVERAYCLVDREEGATEACQQAGIELLAITRRSQLI